MVDTDRIGTSNYFWAFPSKASNQVSDSERESERERERERERASNVWWLLQRKRKLKDLGEQLAESEKKKKSLEQQIKTASVGRDESVRIPFRARWCPDRRVSFRMRGRNC